ncbi:hypothetical protein F0562_015276 [Nyssa sinensis]|uniref:Retrotransposon Copia-like N-terminal domain-containing protein n=1 Tax=Nyssa sinensis TaxID=561372 RepID=A0A5J4ZJY5_9ASTE|nr:hypothetical protein F0562_015276 [Nyssa sinensis]
MARSGQNNNNNRFQPLTSPSLSSTSAPEQVSIENLSSRFFLHSGDHPGLVLVSHSLIGSNFNTWSRVMLIALNAKNKLGFVDGSISQPSPNDLATRLWSRCNSMAASWLLNVVSKEIADSLLYLNSTHAVWTDLHDRFRQSNAPRIFQIKQQLQVLMLDPLPFVAKVFNLVVQEERQRAIGSGQLPSSESMAFNISQPSSSIAAASIQNKPK